MRKSDVAVRDRAALTFAAVGSSRFGWNHARPVLLAAGGVSVAVLVR